jgi:hypothetical protein
VEDCRDESRAETGSEPKPSRKGREMFEHTEAFSSFSVDDNDIAQDPAGNVPVRDRGGLTLGTPRDGRHAPPWRVDGDISLARGTRSAQVNPPDCYRRSGG